MDNLWNAIAKFSLELSIPRIQGLADRIDSLGEIGEIETAREAAGPNLDPRAWKRFKVALGGHPKLDPASVAAALRAGAVVGQMKDESQEVSLAWTGPKTGFVPVRSTEQVMLEIIQGAKEEIFLVSFVNFGAKSILGALNGARNRGVRIRMLLDDAKGAAEKMAQAVPGAEVFVWDEESKVENGSPATASVHAKGIVADEKEALITSANLTDYALEKNMELGVQLEGGREPRLLHQHLRALVETSKVQRYR